jgi:hypothetical protein
MTEFSYLHLKHRCTYQQPSLKCKSDLIQWELTQISKLHVIEEKYLHVIHIPYYYINIIAFYHSPIYTTNLLYSSSSSSSLALQPGVGFSLLHNASPRHLSKAYLKVS